MQQTAPNSEQPSAARGPQDLLGWSLILLLLYFTLFVSPFALKFFLGDLNRPIKALVYGLVLIVVLRSGPARDRLAEVFGHPAAFAYVMLMLGYMGFLTVYSLVGYGEHRSWLTGAPFNPLPNLIGAWLTILFGLIFLLYCARGLFPWVLDRFTDLMLLCSLGAILLTPLLYFQLIQPLAQAPVLTSGLENLPDYSHPYLPFYGLGFVRDYATVAGLKLPRAQSFAQEGGGFAFPLLVAMIWAWHRGRRYALVAMSGALVLTWSVGAFGFCLLLPLLRFFRQPVLGGLLLLGLLSAALLAMLAGWVDADIWAAYWDRKVAASDSSLAGRLADWTLLISTVEGNDWHGFGVGAAGAVIPVTITTSLSGILASGGLGGLCLWLATYSLLLVWAMRRLFAGDSEDRAWSLFILLLVYQSLQRGGIDAYLFNWFLVAGFIVRSCQERLPLAMAGRIPRVLGQPG